MIHRFSRRSLNKYNLQEQAEILNEWWCRTLQETNTRRKSKTSTVRTPSFMPDAESFNASFQTRYFFSKINRSFVYTISRYTQLRSVLHTTLEKRKRTFMTIILINFLTRKLMTNREMERERARKRIRITERARKREKEKE